MLGVMPALVILAVAAVVAAILASVLRLRSRGESLAAASIVTAARAEVDAALAAAKSDAIAERTRQATAHRNEVLAARTLAADELRRAESALEERQQALQRAEAELEAQQEGIEQRRTTLDTEQREVTARRDRATGLVRDTEQRLAGVQQELERIAEVAGHQLSSSMRQGWLDEARAQAAAQLREIEAGIADPAHDREAKRLMEIASSRYQIHFLTERNISNLRLGPELVGLLLENGSAMHGALEKVSNVQLQVNDDRDAIRLDGQDSVGREIARRALGKLQKKPETIDEARKNPEEWAMRARQGMEQEIRSLGKKAFQLLGIINQQIDFLAGCS